MSKKSTNRPFRTQLTIDEQIRQRQRHLRAGCFIILGAFVIGAAIWVAIFYSIFS